MKREPKHTFDIQESYAGRSGKLRFVSLVASSVKPEWCRIFDVLSPVPLALMGGFGIPSSYQHAKNRNLNSASYECSYKLPNGTLRYSYKYRRGIAPRFKLSGVPLLNEIGKSSSKDKLRLSDPKLMVLLYLAQRKARSERGDCELCGQPLSPAECKSTLWHHPNCEQYILYSKDEEREDNARKTD